MPKKKIETIINEKIYPYFLNENGKSCLQKIIRQYPYELLIECIHIGVEKYLQRDNEGKPSQDSVKKFIDKLGGIAYNKSLNPIDGEISYIKNKCKSIFTYYDETEANEVLQNYVNALRASGYNDTVIISDLHKEVNRSVNSFRNWSQWYNNMHNWIEDIKHWNDNDSITIKEEGTIIPTTLFSKLYKNIQSLCKQINSSYENNLYDCTAIMMRRLLEGLLVLSYQNNNIEDKITDTKSGFHFVLDKIIKDAEQNTILALSSNTKKELALFKDLGNYSAHKIWYNCTQQDIKPHLMKYRVIIEELIHKAGLN
jgi:hypothetical protein